MLKYSSSLPNLCFAFFVIIAVFVSTGLSFIPAQRKISRQWIHTFDAVNDLQSDGLVHGGFNHCAMIVHDIEKSVELYQVCSRLLTMNVIDLM